MRCVDADKLYPDCMTKDGKLAISQSQLANAPTVKFSLMPADETKEEAYKRGYEKGKIKGILKANTRQQGDLISKQLVIDAMNEVYCHIEMIKKRPVNKTEQAMYLDMVGAVKSVPTEERPQGKWIPREDMDYIDENKVVHNHFECNKCGFIHDFIDGHTAQYNFCPQCGKDMRKPNCVTCDHFGKCEGCEKGEEE